MDLESVYLFRNLEITLKIWCYLAFVMVLIWWIYLSCSLGYGLVFHCEIHHATWKKSPFLLSLYSNNALTYLDYWLVQAPVDYSVSLSPHGMLDTCYVMSVCCMIKLVPNSWWWFFFGSDVHQRKDKLVSVMGIKYAWSTIATRFNVA
jgi:hypothetical protein